MNRCIAISLDPAKLVQHIEAHSAETYDQSLCVFPLVIMSHMPSVEPALDS